MISNVPFVAGPFCASCQVPVERYTIEFPKDSRGPTTIHGHCHGKTQSVMLTAQQLMQRFDIVLFERKQGFDSHNLDNSKVLHAR